jgi:ABC-type nitrate/sulfonate/bicarbonate transport system ATPase subunit
MNTPLCAIESLTFSFEGSSGPPLFNQFSLSFASHTTYCLLGFSGTGKTTLLRLIGGLLAPQQGRIQFDGERRIGYAPQQQCLLPWLTVRKNLALGSRWRPARGQTSRQRDELAETLGLSDFLQRRPGALSGGMKQRAAFIAALTSGANVLLLDEPFSGSDRRNKESMFDALRKFRDAAEPQLTILATHDVGDVFALGATAVWLDSLTRNPATLAPVCEWDAGERARLISLVSRESI